MVPSTSNPTPQHQTTDSPKVREDRKLTKSETAHVPQWAENAPLISMLRSRAIGCVEKGSDFCMRKTHQHKSPRISDGRQRLLGPNDDFFGGLRATARCSRYLQHRVVESLSCVNRN